MVIRTVREAGKLPTLAGVREAWREVAAIAMLLLAQVLLTLLTPRLSATWW